ncbi:MAG: hypothetical protein V4516_04280 [Pseudomonadota bacterium]
MQWIVVEKTDGQDDKDRDHKGHDHPGRCPNRFFGLWVASGVVAAGVAVWMLIGGRAG